MKTAKFNIGDLVIHQQFAYRAVVIDVDPLFQASGRPNPQANKRPFATRNPWYRLLVDKSSQITYVEECHLIKDLQLKQIENPHVYLYFREWRGGYQPNSVQH